jgi:hypothetical protein
MRYGYLNGWPELRSGLYVIGPGYDLYVQSLAWGKDEMVEAMQEAIADFASSGCEEQEEAA